MEKRILNYRIIVEPDTQTGTQKPGFTAICPTLGVGDDGDTVEEALNNVKKAIKIYVKSLVDDGIDVPHDSIGNDLVTSIQINA